MNPTYDFTGQVALVTGASSGMGPATARAFAEAGAAVVLTDLNPGRPAECHRHAHHRRVPGPRPGQRDQPARGVGVHEA